jgi:tripartite-type tricarboxylate transporter receptor subunit TctC
MRLNQYAAVESGSTKHFQFKLLSHRAAALALTVGALSAGVASAQEAYPAKPVTLVVPQSAGGPVDVLARSFADQLGKLLRQTIIVSNRDGAAGTIGVEAVKQAAPDGYTLGYGTQGPFTIQPNLRKVMRYTTDDFEFVCQTNDLVPIVVVSLKSPYRSLKELIDAARKAPGTITLGSVGIGSGPHIIGEGLALDAGVQFNHIPFRSFGDLNTQLIAGAIDFTVTSPTPRNDVRPLAATGGKRLSTHPDLPLLKELGYKRGALPGLIGLYAPKGTAPAALARLRQACSAAVNSEPFKAASESIAAVRQFADSPQYTENVKQDMRSMTELMQALAVKPE